MNSGTTPAKVTLWPSLGMQPFQSTLKMSFIINATLLFCSRHQWVHSGHPQLRARLCLQQHSGLFSLQPQGQVPGWLHPGRLWQLHWWGWCCPQVWRFSGWMEQSPTESVTNLSAMKDEIECKPSGGGNVIFLTGRSKEMWLNFTVQICRANDMCFSPIRYKRVRHPRQPVPAIPDMQQHRWLLHLQQEHIELQAGLPPDWQRHALWRWTLCEFFFCQKPGWLAKVANVNLAHWCPSCQACSKIRCCALYWLDENKEIGTWSHNYKKRSCNYEIRTWNCAFCLNNPHDLICLRNVDILILTPSSSVSI